MIATASRLLARVEKQGSMGVVSGIATWNKSASCQQGAYFVLCLCATDTSVMFISIEECKY